MTLQKQDLFPDRALRENDADAFRHEAVAGRLAELVTLAELPVRVALFGPWGSGKSSSYELLTRALKGDTTIRVVRYDAGALGADAMRRNLISNLAEQLGIKADSSDKSHRQFHAGLYQKRRTVEFDFADTRDSVRKLFGLVVVVFLGLTALFSLLFGAVSILTDENFGGQIVESLPRLVGPTGGVALAVAFLKLIYDGAKVESEDAQPSADEEFARRLRALVDLVRQRDGLKRLVVFVDELDRSEPEQIVETLGGLRSFLSTEHCAWIVAADRAALERALKADPPGATPAHTDAAYYATVGAYLDKVFTHQVALPPMRSTTLLGFALREASSSGGLWENLRDGARPDLEDVLYALIPSHVRSPRRVKVLLNAYATAARIAEARGFGWRGRADELAKLVALQIEFPGLAADLINEPRLPTMLLAPPNNAGPRLQTLLSKHKLTANEVTPEAFKASDTDDENDEEEAPPVEPAPMLVTSDLLQDAAQADLRRFLVRTAPIPDPGLDMLYLEEARKDLGLTDRSLAITLELEARDDPQAAREAIAAAELEQRAPAIQLLAGLSHQASGQERRNLIAAMLGAYRDLAENEAEDSRSPAHRDAFNAVAAAERAVGVPGSDLPGVLRLYLDQPGGAPDVALIESLIERPEMLNGENLAFAADVHDRLPTGARQSVSAAVVKRVDADATSGWGAMRRLPDAAAADAIEAVLDEIDDEGRTQARVELRAFMAMHQTCPLAARQALWYWFDESEEYREYQEDALATIAASPDDGLLPALCARLICVSPVDDWTVLAERFEGSEAPRWGVTDRHRVRAAARLVELLASGQASIVEARPLLRQILPGTGAVDEATRSSFRERCSSALASRT